MIQSKIIKLKKYLFLISILFLVLSLTHLVYIYIYSDSKLVPIKGGTVSEGLIGNFPSLNPLKTLNGNNKYIVSLLYRSLLKYDLEENKIVGDLANCDISNLLNIECYLKDNIFWSNGEPITTNDVIATYNILKNTGVNKVTSSLLEETEIEQNDNVIIFKNTKKDINFLNVFFQPIIEKETLDTLGQETIFGNFPTHGQIYSGEFKISNISSDLTIGITKIFLDVNEYFYKGNISKLVINLFPNTNSLLQNKETINIFNDVDNIIGNSIPRLENHKYTLPQYVSLFINQNKVKNQSLRNYIFEKINTQNLLKILGEDNYKIVNNPYLTDTNIENEISNKNFEKIISDLGYIKKSKIIENYIPKSNEKYSDEVNIEEKKPEEEESEITLDIDDTELTIDKFQVDSKYIIDPVYVDKYNFITKDDVLLTGKAGINVEEVYINEYKLSNFKTGDKYFYYRLKESFGSIKQGENNYKIYFVENGEKNLKEEINFLFYRNKSRLDTETKNYIKNLYLEEKKEVAITEEKVKEEKEVIEIDKDKLEKLSNLDEKFYYNDKLEKFTLNLFYLSTERELEETALFIKNSLLEIGVNVELFPISINDLRDVLLEKDEYDMILTGVNLGLFDYNIFPYFHSSQVKSGYNFSNTKKTSLDILLEDLKSELKTPEEINKIKEKILEILKKEQVVKTLYTPKMNLLIDKNIKNIIIPSKLTNKSDRKDIFSSLYIKEEKILNMENKGILDFFNFLLKKLND